MGINKKENLLNLINNSRRADIIFLSILGILALLIRLIFLPFDLVLSNDSVGYFWYANDVILLGKLPTEISPSIDSQLPNNGWPLFLSLFFIMIDSNNFLDYMNIQRMVSMFVSIFTIIPMYFLAKKFFTKSYALIVSAFFIFEPRLIENSLLGITEPLYLFLGITTLCFFLSKQQKLIITSFAIAALFSLVRYEGLLIIAPLTILYFYRFHKNKEQILTYFLALTIFILILISMGFLRMDSTGSDGLSSHVLAGGTYYSNMINVEGNEIIQEFFVNGTTNLGKYFLLILIPLFLICLPYGILNLIKNKDEKKWTLILTGLVFLIPAFYAYSRGFQDTRYLFIFVPILSIISVYFIKLIEQKIGKQNTVFISVLILIIFISFSFINLIITDYSLEREKYEISLIINDITTSVNRDYNSVTYLKWSDGDVQRNFPIISTDVRQKDRVKIIKIGNTLKNEFTNLQDYFSFGYKAGLTHLVLDNDNINNQYLQEIFQNEEEYIFLTKIFDSKESGYRYHVKVFKIDYKIFDKWK